VTAGFSSDPSSRATAILAIKQAFLEKLTKIYPNHNPSDKYPGDLIAEIRTDLITTLVPERVETLSGVPVRQIIADARRFVATKGDEAVKTYEKRLTLLYSIVSPQYKRAFEDVRKAYETDPAFSDLLTKLGPNGPKFNI
ncbi:hypothetical protein HZC07_02725, partial [Candidatus Micrarchaeota archaeon]|nr:hypothetical protein [Candidatus Micrarchaeota archaeon]